MKTMEPRSFKILKQGLKMEDKVENLWLLSEPQQETARTQSLCPKDNGSIYSQQGKKTFSLAARAKTPSGVNCPKNEKHQGKDVEEFKKEKEKQANSCVCARTHAQEVNGKETASTRTGCS